ncbi:MAG: 50S ribosomal protein L3 [Eubacteriales bacterium]|nr:50S ribosomal protein L3 [Eubacteriales bacterium]
MKKAILGKKLGMTQIFTPDGLVVPVTVVEAGPCSVVQKKTNEKDGYEAIVVAFNQTKENRLNKAQLGVLKKAGVQPAKILREFKFDNSADYEIGKEIKADIFAENDMVDVSGTTRGRGFTGNIQRWNAHRLKMTHGVGPVHREVGSMGANSTPSRVFKNKKMPGHYGAEKVTIQNLEVVKVDSDRNILLIKGCVPGPKGSIVTIKEAVKR